MFDALKAQKRGSKVVASFAPQNKVHKATKDGTNTLRTYNQKWMMVASTRAGHISEAHQRLHEDIRNIVA